MIQHHQGKLIVIEGGDGSGKGTQSALLRDYFDKNNIPYAYVDFPDYESLYGKIIARFLRGEFGSLEEISPYFVGTLFGLDRSLQKAAIEKHLQEGKIVLANRYTTSNMAHQGSKCATEAERDSFMAWLDTFEYSVLGLPRESLVMYLYVPWHIASELTKAKDARDYLKGEAQDIQEKDTSHRVDTEQMYQYLAKKHSHWATIDCTKNGTILSKEEIHRMLVTLLQQRSIL